MDMLSSITSHVTGNSAAFPISPSSTNTMTTGFDGFHQSPVNEMSHVGSSYGPSIHSPDNDNSGYNETTAEAHSDKNDGTSNSGGAPRKKRRSRKGLSKRFECPAEGCGKSYSRAEHLYRHQLNHNSKQVFRCEYPDCTRTFVRSDLLKRHMERHAAKGTQVGRNEAAIQVDTGTASEITPPFSGHQAGIAYGNANHAQSHYLSPQEPIHSPYTSGSNTSPAGHQVGYPSNVPENYGMDMTGSTRGHHIARDNVLHPPPQSAPQASFAYAGTLSSPTASSHPRFYPSQGQSIASPQQMSNYNTNQQHMPPDMQASPPAANGSLSAMQVPGQGYSVVAVSDGQDALLQQPTDIITLDQMSMPGVGPVFGDDGGLGKSPYVGMPEDFMAYLFNSLPNQSSPTTTEFQLPVPGSNYGDLQDTQYSAPFMGQGVAAMTQFHTTSQHIMSVNSLLDDNSPETNISEERSQEIFDYIKDRFHENDVPSTERRRESIVGGDRDGDEHMLSRRMMQAYLGSYWYHFSDQLPILHRPTFSSDKAPDLLLLAMMTIGAACLDRTHGQQVLTAGAKISNFLARHLRWEIFMSSDFRPPAKLWVFQTLILLESYEKMFSTRELHERAHIHHASTITLMRRGRSLIGKSSVDSPPNQKDGANSSRSASGGVAQTPEEWWNHWIANEATRRAAFAAFIIDSTHATMFGHSAVMVTHEMRLPLPCDESLWKARSGAEVGRAESSLASRGIRQISFLEGLKRTLSHQEVKTTSFGRTALMAGLLSVTYHMHQRDLQVNVLGGGVIQALGGRDKWRAALTRAYDSWKSDFDRALEEIEPSNDPYGQHKARTESHMVFGSGTVLHHLAHMAMHADIVDCQMFARAKRLLGRTIGSQEFSSAQRRVKTLWAPSAKARDATFYALKFLRSVLLPDSTAIGNSMGPWPEGSYETRYDVLMNRPWVVYFAALVVWCYGFALEGPCDDGPNYHAAEDNQRQMQQYLLRYGSAQDPNELRSMKGINNNTALLTVLRDSFENTRWDLLHEGANLIRNCIILNGGGTV